MTNREETCGEGWNIGGRTLQARLSDSSGNDDAVAL